jgi:hypothetical protein
VECRRRYDVPAPLGLWGTEVPQQFYFMRRTGTYARGCGSSSGSREIQSYFSLASLELARRGCRMACYVLLYDRHNRLLLAHTLPSFALIPGTVGSNCSEPVDTIRTLTRSAVGVSESERGGRLQIRIENPL